MSTQRSETPHSVTAADHHFKAPALQVTVAASRSGTEELALELPAGIRIRRWSPGERRVALNQPHQCPDYPNACIATDRWEDDGGATSSGRFPSSRRQRSAWRRSISQTQRESFESSD